MNSKRRLRVNRSSPYQEGRENSGQKQMLQDTPQEECYLKNRMESGNQQLSCQEQCKPQNETTVAEMKGTILTASIDNRTTNAMNITQMAEDLHYLIQSDMDDRAFQVQRRLADELDRYKGKGNSYVDVNIREIQELYMDEEAKREEGRIEDEEVILIKPYEVSSSMSISTHSTSCQDR